MMARSIVLLLVWSLVGAVLPVSAQADDVIRVLLAQDVPRIQISAERRLSVRGGSGQELVFAAPVTIIAAPDGTVSLNGEPVSSIAGLTVSSGGGGLLLSVGQGGESYAPPLAMSGTLRVLRGKSPGGLAVVNHVEVEEYVKGVVPAEMNAAWHPEALKVQAVVARTYALYQRQANREREYDVAASTQDQVYRGRQGVDQRVQDAVESTKNLTLTYQNEPILAAFSSTAAGPTEDAMNVWSKDVPYLKGVDCPFDANSPYYQWRAEFKLQDLEDKLNRQGLAIGTIANLAPLAYSSAGRVARLRILHSQGELVLRGEDLRRLVGYGVIQSTQFEVESIGKTVVLSGRGAGHAVGLCQWGAKEMADLGYRFDTILRYYFPGTELKTWRATAQLSRPQPYSPF
ncbi:MAG: SpoIID/LytB domain-containing protein [Nitrospirota bacterium]|nr:SpoIID/LytB domain-containing protein [Nitrospirota bacterium]MDE3225152.1 SpoIID/LytB domain-containing protein [Nitrospirota bacterium]MDE3242526.1 SpoIID/LytB domain-containing protein [Nitrospirota bacterium]